MQYTASPHYRLNGGCMHLELGHAKTRYWDDRISSGHKGHNITRTTDNARIGHNGYEGYDMTQTTDNARIGYDGYKGHNITEVT